MVAVQSEEKSQTRGVAQAVDYLPSKPNVMSSTPSTTQKKKKRVNRGPSCCTKIDSVSSKINIQVSILFYSVIHLSYSSLSL
jgi:hypothetical protein